MDIADELLEMLWEIGLPVSPHLGPFAPISEADATELLEALDLPRALQAKRELQEVVGRSVLHLASLYTVDETERIGEPTLANYAADPARAMVSPPASLGGAFLRQILRSWAALRGIDPDSVAAVVFAGDKAREILQGATAYRGTSFRVGEAALFVEVYKIARALNPASLREIPDKDAAAWPTPLPPILDFSTKYVDMVAGRAGEAIGLSNHRAMRRLAWLNSKADHAKRLRNARQFLRRKEANTTVKG